MVTESRPPQEGPLRGLHRRPESMNSSKNKILTLKYPTYFLTKKKSTKAKTANAVTAAKTPIPTFNLLFSSFSTSFMLESL